MNWINLNISKSNLNGFISCLFPFEFAKYPARAKTLHTQCVEKRQKYIFHQMSIFEVP